MNNNSEGKYGIIIFDGSCGMCSALIAEKKPFFEKYGFKIAPLQEEWVRNLTGLNEASLLQAIHLRTNEGEILKGIDFIRYFAGKVWWLYPAYLILSIKFLKPLFIKLYDFIASRRRKISAVCRLQSRALYK